jgi:hypothetical protein
MRINLECDDGKGEWVTWLVVWGIHYWEGRVWGWLVGGECEVAFFSTGWDLSGGTWGQVVRFDNSFAARGTRGCEA